jgi:acyl-CoA thioesterase FadM
MSSKISSSFVYLPLTAVVSIAVGYSLAQVVPDFFYSLRMNFIEMVTGKQSDPEITLDKSGIVYHAIVLPVDIDRNGHMNNFRYIRELNFARRHFFVSSGLWSYLQAQKLNLIVRTQTIRHRKELHCWQRYTIRTRLLGWSEIDKSYYLEARFEIDGFVHAIHHTKYIIIRQKGIDRKKVSPTLLLQSAMVNIHNNLSLSEKENLPLFISTWNEANEISSQELNPTKDRSVCFADKS